MRELKVVVLLSTGIHPISLRPRMAPGDARALEMALLLTPQPVALHAGDPENIALRDYLGMGVDAIEVLAMGSDGDDIVPMLRSRLGEIAPDIILTGMSADKGEAGGMVPYLLARDLGIKHLSSIAQIESFNGSEVVLVQAFKGAIRRRLAARLPLSISASELSPVPRARAFAKSRRGTIKTTVVSSTPDNEAATWTRSAARRRPKKISMGQSAGNGPPLTGLAPEEAARRILDFLWEKRITGESGR